MKKTFLTDRFFYLTVSLFSIYLLTCNLGQNPFWDDEAMVSWLANNLNQFGKITTNDGFNAFLYRNGSLLEYKNPPLDIYYCAFIQKFFGLGEIKERLGFSILGILTLPIFYLIIQKINSHELFKKMAFLSYSLSINLILFSRNCRYFVLTIFFGILIYFFSLVYKHTLDSVKKKVLSIFISISFLLLFFSHYTQAIVWGLFCFFIFYFRDNTINTLKSNKFLFICLSFVSLICIYFSLSNDIHQRSDFVNSDFILIKYLKLTFWFIIEQHKYNFIPIWSILFLFNSRIRQFLLNPYNDTIIKYGKECLLFIFLSILFSPQDSSSSSQFDMRYCTIGFFLFYIFIAFIFSQLIINNKKYKLIFYSIFILNIFTNLLFYIPIDNPVRFTTLGFIYEMHSDYKTPISQAMKYLDTIELKNTSIATIPNFNNTILTKYYSPKIKLSNCIDSLKFNNHDLISSLNISNPYFSNIPDIIIQFGDRHEKQFSEFGLKKENYRRIDTIPFFSNDGYDYSRPELVWHNFKETNDFNRSKKSIYVFRK